jgi:TIR domain
MADIFISYERSDHPRARAIAEALEQQGWSVWWDRKILPGATFDKTIEKALAEAKCVIVLWSKTSVLSDWVKDEASEGVQHGNLIPLLIDNVEIPLGFRRIQTARKTRLDPCKKKGLG